MRRRFFVKQFDGDKAVLRAESAHHLGHVLRAEMGQSYELSDGETVRLGRVNRIDRDEIEFELTETVTDVAPPRLAITLLLSIVKFDRFEWALEKATELGVDEIVPLSAARTEKGLILAAPKRSERWQRILMESSQQARRLRPPVLHGVEGVSEKFVMGSDEDSPNKTGLRIILSERSDARPLREILGGHSRESTHAATLAIGPEGGWTDDEFEMAETGGFEEVSLGNNILRTETAVMAALASLNLVFG
ncbi:MAG TPA: RsmE family RNA methyltransferase [Candidatus Acidoferrales bacterium]